MNSDRDMLFRAYLGYRTLAAALPKARLPHMAAALKPFIEEVEAAHPEFAEEARRGER